MEIRHYHPKIITRVAERQAALTGADAAALAYTAVHNAVAAAKLQKDHLVTSAVLRSAREKVFSSLPTRDNIKNRDTVKVEVDVAALSKAESIRFDSMIETANWEGLLARYPMRESSAFDRVVAAIKIPDRETYRAAVLKLIQDDESVLSELRSLLGDLYTEVMAEPDPAPVSLPSLQA